MGLESAQELGTQSKPWQKANPLHESSFPGVPEYIPDTSCAPTAESKCLTHSHEPLRWGAGAGFIWRNLRPCLNDGSLKNQISCDFEDMDVLLFKRK
jgi:hypothetical protein